MNPIACYEFRHSVDDITVEQIKAELRSHCKKWAFQKEKSDTGYIHYQGHFSLIKKRRKDELLKLLTIKFMYLQPMHDTENIYCLKKDTRIDGPWQDVDKELYIPRQFQKLKDNLYPYQQHIWNEKNNYSREINLLYCPNGNQGKTTIAALMDLYGRGIDLPPVNDMKELLQVACDICIAKQIRDPNAVFVDLPRAFMKDTLRGIYSAIEQIKKGKLYDMRYHYKEWWIDSPIIWVFTNEPPDLTMLSLDRWRVWELNELKELVKFDENKILL